MPNINRGIKISNKLENCIIRMNLRFFFDVMIFIDGALKCLEKILRFADIIKEVQISSILPLISMYLRMFLKKTKKTFDFLKIYDRINL
jgi:hypothetical protein